MTGTRDVVVVGAGHNALVAACYLARAGLDVEVVERREVVGGAASTVERFPGYLVDVGSSAHLLVRHTGIPEELGLDRFGLAYRDLDPWAYAPFEDGAIAFHADVDATCESIAALCGHADAEAYATFASDWADRNERVFQLFQEAPVPAALGRHLWGMGRGEAVSGWELARQFLTTGDALLDATFRDERLKTALAWLGAQSGAPSDQVATADLVGWNVLCHRRPPGRPIGGSGMLSVALARRLASDGGRIRLGDAVERVTVRDGRARGIVTASGERISARVVIAGCHVLTTLRLVGAAHWPPGFAARARATMRTGGGVGMAVRVGCRALPPYPHALPGGSEHHGLQLLARDRQQLRQAHAAFRTGATPDRPPVLAMTFSALDPSIAPPDRHNVTIWGQWHPYELRGEDWDAVAEREAAKLIAAVDRAAPGWSASIEHVHVQTPLELERELGLVDGQVMHLEMALDQMFGFRPLPELAGYATPVEGLYLTGASTHPGGGVFGASGRSAARRVLADRARAALPWHRAARGVRSAGERVVRRVAGGHPGG